VHKFIMGDDGIMLMPNDDKSKSSANKKKQGFLIKTDK